MTGRTIDQSHLARATSAQLRVGSVRPGPVPLVATPLSHFFVADYASGQPVVLRPILSTSEKPREV